MNVTRFTIALGSRTLFIASQAERWGELTMRTSGASTETNMSVAVFVIAAALLVFFAGGPSECMRIFDHTVKVAFEYCAQLYHGSRG